MISKMDYFRPGKLPLFFPFVILQMSRRETRARRGFSRKRERKKKVSFYPSSECQSRAEIMIKALRPLLPAICFGFATFQGFFLYLLFTTSIDESIL